MKRSRLLIFVNGLLLLLLVTFTGAAARTPMPQTTVPQGTALGTAFTYQGQLKKGGQPFTGACDFQFGIYDAAVGSTQIGSTLTKGDVKVIEGVFAVQLDFGANAFPGDARWLQVAVKCPGDSSFVTFNSRQELTPTPYALGLRLPLDQTTNVSDSGLIIRNTGGRGIYGIGTNGTGVEGMSDRAAGVVGTSNQWRGVVGTSTNEVGVYGESVTSGGVFGVSKKWRGVVGISESEFGVSGESTSGGGVLGVSKTARGVTGISTGEIGVVGQSRDNSGVAGFSENGAGVYGKSTHNYAGLFEGKVRVSVLEIAGGADLAEPFDVASVGATSPSPGMVVCIDPANPGKLVVCSSNYDQTVAGVISGAGGVQPGMVMQQEGSKASGQHPIALTGRVYVWADATAHPVQPGDLLTTSATPGHAIKVTDYGQAQGAVIGKAMTALPAGKGLVLVLVGMQ